MKLYVRDSQNDGDARKHEKKMLVLFLFDLIKLSRARRLQNESLNFIVFKGNDERYRV